MKKLAQIITLLAALSLGGCNTETTVVVPEGPKATALNKAKDEQIAGLAAQVKAEQTARELAIRQASFAAANFETILFAAGYVDMGLPRNAIEEEAKLGLARSPAPDPLEIIRGKNRAIAILQNDVAKAKEAYGKAFDEANQAKAQMAALDSEIAKRERTIAERDTDIKRLTQEKLDEQEAHKADVKKAIDDKNEEIRKLKDAYATKERAQWVLWTRIAGLGFIVVGVVIMVVFKVVPEGAGLAGSGVIIGLVSIFIDWLTAQWWFGWMMGGILLASLGVGVYALYRMWKTHQLHAKMSAALQDLKDEAVTLGNDTWTKVEDHLKYRLGGKDSFWGKAQVKEVAKMGLINPAAEPKDEGKS